MERNDGRRAQGVQLIDPGGASYGVEHDDGKLRVSALLMDSAGLEMFSVTNPARVDLGDVLEQILLELQRINEQLALLTDTPIDAGEQLGG